jgi:hypothetical protein
MVNLEYHKGSFCIYSSVFCQEGYCSGCSVYSQMSAAAKFVNSREENKSQQAPKLVLAH